MTLENTKKSNLDEVSQLEKKLKELVEIRKDITKIKKHVENGLKEAPYQKHYEKLMRELPKKDSEDYLIGLFNVLYVDPILKKYIKHYQ